MISIQERCISFKFQPIQRANHCFDNVMYSKKPFTSYRLDAVIKISRTFFALDSFSLACVRFACDCVIYL